MSRRIAACLVCLAAAGSAAAVQSASPHARVELLARQNAASPGANLQLGVHFVLEPGWHIYWINPGDSGQPPVLQWQLPAGFNAGEIQWPTPERMQSSAQLADYGYHGEVLLPVALHVPSSAATGRPIEITVEAKWLVCREVCLPARSQLHLSLPMAASAREDPQSAPLFARTEKLLPRPMPRQWQASARAEKDGLILQVRTGKRVSKAEFFPLDPDQVDNAAPQRLRPLPAGAKITLKKSDLLLKPIHVLRGVLALGDGTAYRIEAPVR